MRTSSWVGVAGLIVVGLIVADIVIHGSQAATAFNSLSSGLIVPSEAGLLGQPVRKA